MKLSDILTETKIIQLDISGNDLLVLDNPSPEALLNKFKQWGGARGLLIGEHTYWWDDNAAIHSRVAKELMPDWPAGSGRFHMYLVRVGGGQILLEIPQAEVREASANYYIRRLIGDSRITLNPIK